jgi:hypothetical protein
VERATACATSAVIEIALVITLKASKESQGKQRKMQAYLNYFFNMCHLLVVIILSNNISTSHCDLQLEVSCFLLRDIEHHLEKIM